MDQAPKPSRDITDLIRLMAALRTPGTGCPWDLDQTFATIAPYTIEEAHEVADAIARNDMVDLCDELGDLLLQVVFHARMAEEAGLFGFDDVVEAISAKLIRRHPHVFGNTRNLSPEAVKGLWSQIKAQEKADRLARKCQSGSLNPSALDGVSAGEPALGRALKIQDKAGHVGFDWNDPRAVLAKIREECDEIDAEIASGNKDKQAEEVGDLLFAVVNLARHVKADPDTALRAATTKFEHRFRAVEAILAQAGARPETSTLEEMERAWTQAKAAGKPSADPGEQAP